MLVAECRVADISISGHCDQGLEDKLPGSLPKQSTALAGTKSSPITVIIGKLFHVPGLSVLSLFTLLDALGGVDSTHLTDGRSEAAPSLPAGHVAA